MMTTRKERQHLIWAKLEHIAREINEVLELARNGEQIELLRVQTGTIDLLREVLDLLRQIQGSRKGGIGAPDNIYLPQLRIDVIDALAGKIVEFLNDGPKDEPQDD